MSSIDKYVEGEARKYNPNVQVYSRGGRIQGYVGNSLVFDIADHYGYLSDDERSIIRNSISLYDEQKRAQERERQMRENQRIEARENLRRNIASAKRSLEQSYKNACDLYKKAKSDLTLKSKLDAIDNLNVSGYIPRIEEIEGQILACQNKADEEYRSRCQKLNEFEKNVRDDSTTNKYNEQRESLRRISTHVSGRALPVEEIESLDDELNRIAKISVRVEELKSQLEKMDVAGLSAGIVKNLLETIKTHPINSPDDLVDLVHHIEGKITEINDIESNQKLKDRAKNISLMNGMIQAYSSLRDLTAVQHYRAASHREEIVRVANEVLYTYSALRSADYTTCKDERIVSVCDTVQEVLIGTKSDEDTLKSMKSLLDEGIMYRSKDSLQADNYAEYRRFVDELLDKGVSFESIEKFDPSDYENQRRRILEQMLQAEISLTTSKTRTTFIIACEAMEKMGYRMLHYNMGSGGEDSLACEAIYVIPGCDGAVVRIIASDSNLRRSVIGIERTSGSITSIERVREICEKIERIGEIDEYFSIYSEAMGGNHLVTEAIDSDTYDSDDAIYNNGSFKLDEEGERIYDELVASGSSEQRALWDSNMASNAHTKSVKATGSKHSDDERRRESARCREKVMAKRRK